MTGKILVVDPVATNRIILKAKLSARAYDAVAVADAACALERAGIDAPDLVLVADALPEDGCARLCADLRASQAGADLPIVVLTDGTTRPMASDSLSAGADDMLDRQTDDAALFARLRSLLRDYATRQDLATRLPRAVYADAARIDWHKPALGRIGWVCTLKAHALRHQARLSAIGLTRVSLMDPTDVPSDTDAAPGPDIFLIDQDLGRHGTGLSTLSELRARHHPRDIDAVVLMDAGNDMAAAFDLGARAVLQGALDTTELSHRISALLRRKFQRDRLRAALDAEIAHATTDMLTGLCNRRATMDALEHMGQPGQAFALMVIDIDHFKSVNDTWGHPAGDAVLAAVARRLQRHMGEGSVLGRIGGEEFLAALPLRSPQAAHSLAEALRREVSGQHVDLPDQQGAIAVTVSIGVTLWAPYVSLRGAIAQADTALYQAKRSGRDRVIVLETQAAA